MVRLRVGRDRDPEAGLDVAERARARTLLDAIGGSSARPMLARDVASRLPAGSAALFYVTLNDRLLLWVLRREGIQFIECPVSLQDLRFRTARVNRLLTDSIGAAARRDALKETLRALFVDLIAPARDSLGSVKTLIILPDGPLHLLPFSALVDPDRGRHLIQDYVIVNAPSLTIFERASRVARRPSEPRVLLIGDPTKDRANRAVQALPFAVEEAQSLARLYRDARVLLASEATREAFLAGLHDADIVHYAGHAVVDLQDPLRSRLLLAASPSDPDGSLFAGELRETTLPRHPLIVLAACSTSRGQIAIGEGVLSLARPFLEAGASTVLGTLWDVDDRVSLMLFRRFHTHLANGMPVASALAEAQRELLDDPAAARDGLGAWAWAVAIGGETP